MPRALAAAEPATKPVTWIDVDLGDSGVTLVEFPDGLFKLEIDGGETLLNVDQMKAVSAGFAALKKAKGWRR